MKQRLYAFLIKRLLGPLLDEKSLEELHHSIDVSLQEGKFSLSQIHLNAHYLNRQLDRRRSEFLIRSAVLERLEIQLSLVETNSALAESSSLTWRAIQMVNAASAAPENSQAKPPSVHLLCEVFLDGLRIEVVPYSASVDTVASEIDEPDDVASETASRGYMARYLDALLASLRLAVRLNDLSIRLLSTCKEDNKEIWLDCLASQLLYRDKLKQSAKDGTGTDQNSAIFSKALEFIGVSLVVGESTADCSPDITYSSSRSAQSQSNVAIAESSGRSILLARLEVAQLEVHAKQTQHPDQTKALTNEIGLTLPQRASFSLSMEALSLVHQLLGSLAVERSQRCSKSDVFSAKGQSTGDLLDHLDEGFMDDAAVSVLKRFAEQYDEARALIEQNYFRGGVLLPADEDEDDVCFEAFFDANETGLGHFSSVLMESLISTRDKESSSSVTTRVRLTLTDGNVKVALTESVDTEPLRPCDNYILCTISELHVALSIGEVENTFTLSVAHFDVDCFHSQTTRQSTFEESFPFSNKDGRIHRLLRFRPAHSDVLIQAPCISVTLSANASAAEVDVAAQSVELLYHEDAMKSLVRLFEYIAHLDLATSDTPAAMATSARRTLTVYASLPSLTLSVPVTTDEDCTMLFRRCGYICDEMGLPFGVVVGLLIVNIVFESRDVFDEPAYCISSTRIDAFVAMPTGDRPATLRFDILSLSGYDDERASYPLRFEWSRADGGKENLGSQSFPKVPPISSFKARQQDDDEDNRIDRILFSDIKGINITTRSDLRGADPQADMILAASSCSFLLSISVPECSGDMTTIELSLLASILEKCVFTCKQSEAVQAGATRDAKEESGGSISVAWQCDFASFALHTAGLTGEGSLHGSLLLNLSQMKGHYLHLRGRPYHHRVIVQEVDGFHCCSPELTRGGLGHPSPSQRNTSFSKVPPSGLLEPVLYRSHLFQPISKESPAVVFDIVNRKSGEHNQRAFYLTIYDTTIRCSADSALKREWHRLLQQLGDGNKHASSPGKDEIRLWRVFMSLADCNIDYSSSPHRQANSRVIIRIGDLRLSSNLVFPKPLVQAFSVALCDGAIYLCNTRFPYTFENACIPRSPSYLSPSQRNLKTIGCDDGVASSKVLELMDWLTIATLDSFDAVVTVRGNTRLNTADAGVQTSLTIGELSIYACKDSFAKLLTTVAELSADLTVLDKASLDSLKAFTYGNFPTTYISASTLDAPQTTIKDNISAEPLSESGFMLDGYDWTTVDKDTNFLDMGAGDEQSARWYEQDQNQNEKSIQALHTSEPYIHLGHRGPVLLSDHFPLQTVPDPLHDLSDMGISKLIGEVSKPEVNSRILIHDLTLKVRFFDGFDWPALLDSSQRSLASTGAFTIEKASQRIVGDAAITKDNLPSSMNENSCSVKAQLMANLLQSDDDVSSAMFKATPLPDERSKRANEQAHKRRLGRKSAKYFQFALTGVSLRFDSLNRAEDHRMASCLNLKVQDFYAAETVSGERPVKMAGEWLNEDEHPRETSDGLLAMKLVTWHPKVRVTEDNKINSDECEAVVKVLPLRCILDQRAIRFIRIFLQQDTGDNQRSNGDEDAFWLPPPLFKSFRFKPFKLKVDYRPERIDTDALRSGAVVELVNLSPIDSMVLTLRQVDMADLIGYGEVLSTVTRHWIEDVCSTQLLKFLTNSRPLEPFKTVGQGAGDLVVLPWEALQNGESLKKALRAGAKSFTKALVYEAFTVTSRTTEFIADQISKLSVRTIGSNTLPSRPLKAPRGVLDTTPHVVESLTRGLQAANYKIVVVPYREYKRVGTRGAVTSILKGIPVAIAAPTSGAVEAISYGMIGARNQLAPEIRKEEDANLRGLHWER